MTRLWRSIVSTIVVCGITMFALRALVENPFAQKFLRIASSERLEAVLGITLDFEDVAFDPLKFELKVANFSLKAKDPDGKPRTLWHGNYATIRLAILNLLLGKKRVIDVEVFGVAATWPLPKWLKLKEMPAQDGPSEHYLGTLKLTNFQVDIDLTKNLEPAPIQAQLRGFNADLKFNSASSLSGAISSSALSFALQDRTVVQSARIATSIELSNNKVAAKNIYIDSSTLQTKGAELRISQKEDKRKGKGTNIKASGTTKFDFSILANTLGWKGSKGLGSGDLELDLFIPAAKTEEISLSLSGKAKSHGAKLSGIHLHDSEADFVADQHQIEFTKARLIVDNNGVGDFKGHIAFKHDIDFAFRGSAQHLKLGTVLKTFGSDFSLVNFSASSQDLRIYGTGKPFKLHITGDSALSELDFPDVKRQRESPHPLPSCDAKLALSFDSEQMSWGDSIADCFSPANPRKDNSTELITSGPDAQAKSRVQFVGKINWKSGSDFSILAPYLDISLASAFLPIDVGGAGSIDIKVKTQAGITRTEAMLDLDDVVIGSSPFDQVSGRLTIDKRRLVWSNLKSKYGKELVVSPKGSFNWARKNLKFQVSIETSPLQKFLNIFPNMHNIPLAAHIDRGQFTGEIPQLDPQKASLEGMVTLHNMRWQQRTFAVNSSISLKKFGNKIIVDQFYFDTGLTPIAGRAQIKKASFSQGFHPDDEIELSFLDHIHSPQPLKNFLWFSDVLKNTKGQAVVQIDGTVRGKLADLSGSVKIRASELVVNDVFVPDFIAETLIDGQDLTLMLMQESGDQLQGRVEVGLKDGLPYTAQMSTRQLDLRALISPYLKVDARSFSYISAQLRLNGNLEDPLASNGELRIDRLLFKYYPQFTQNDRPLFVDLERPVTLKVSPKSWSFAEHKSATLNGYGFKSQLSLGNSTPNNLDLSARTTVNLKVLERMFGAVKAASGKLDIDTKLSGPLTNTKLTAKIRNSPVDPNISLRIVKLRPALRDIIVDTRIQDGIFTIDSLRAKKGPGSVELSGNIDLRKFPDSLPVDLKFQLDEASIHLDTDYFDQINTVLDGNLSIAGSNRPYDVQGNIDIVRASSQKEIVTKSRGIEYAQKLIGQTYSSANRVPHFDLSISLSANNSLSVKNQHTDLSLSTNLNISGSEFRPILLGSVEIEKGKFYYQRELRIERGEILFDDPINNEAKLNIIASAIVNQYVVTIYLTGTTTKPLVDIRVDPSTKDDGSAISRLDAIILLSRGSLPTTDRYAQESRGLATATALNLYASQLPFDKFNELTGQKFISPYVDYTTDDQGNPAPQLNVPIQISEVVEAIFKQIPEKTMMVIMVPLSENIAISGNAASVNQVKSDEEQYSSNVNLKFSFPFR